jgi:MOSC domain-containing protein YiiM
MAVIVTGLGIADAKGSFVTREVDRLTLVWGGVEGDRHFGLTAPAGVRQKHHPKGTEIRNARQVSIVSEEELAQVAATLGVAQVAWQWLGANLCLRGLPQLTAIAPSTRLMFPSGACIVIDGENKPCVGPGRVVQQQSGAPPELASQFVKAAFHLRGVVGWVERPGVIEAGSPLEVIR